MFFVGLYGQHNAKKPKILKQSLDNTYDCITPMTGSIPSPVASQMSNMTNPSKFIKLIGGRDRGRKAKSLKVLFDFPFNIVLLCYFICFVYFNLLSMFFFPVVMYCCLIL